MLEQFRIIVVDDDQPHLEALCSQLQEAGFDVNGFSDSTVALEQLTSQRFDVLFIRLQLTGVDGIELVQRAQQLDPDLSTVLITDQGSIKTAIDALKFGVLDYVLMPLKLSELSSFPPPKIRVLKS